MNDLRAHFRPEFLNRLDETIMFKPLTKNNIGGIIKLLLADVNKRLADKEISVELSAQAEQYVIDGGYDPIYGARPLRRAIQTELEDKLAEAILNGEISTGDEVEAGVSKKEIKFFTKPLNN